ncbi:prolyl oligopeptidase family serine peptidase [Halobacillus litoralis]|uniref:alpha/beta hydrolase family protein n=1 Tax=Halobacillus litoralis TaxID=45668 RepID=UPI001CD30F2B|nr:prolyl oligopeptidase family serine peptidase [Halobacillus litoralis]MCA0969194.1 prolyl oligopeptidase family serine peptidase [Halobacillus litoralis]
MIQAACKTIILICMISILVSCSTEPEPKQIVDRETITYETPYPDTVTERMTYKSDGLNITGYIVKPEDHEGKLPVLYYNRGGNKQFGSISEQTLRYLTYWADQGYLVLASQYRGTEGGEGEDEFGGADVKDMLNLAEVAGELPEADLDQTFMLGRSRGGMMTYLAVKEDMNLDAVAVVAGPSDLTALYEQRGDIMKRVLVELVGFPEKNEEAYIERSAVHWADELDVPTLILHGTADWRIEVSHARELSRKLELAGAGYKYVEYPEDDHILTQHFEEHLQEISEWFDQHKTKEAS